MTPNDLFLSIMDGIISGIPNEKNAMAKFVAKGISGALSGRGRAAKKIPISGATGPRPNVNSPNNPLRAFGRRTNSRPTTNAAIQNAPWYQEVGQGLQGMDPYSLGIGAAGIGFGLGSMGNNS